MQKIKIVIALVAVAAMTLAAVGLAAAQIAQNQNSRYSEQVQDGGFWGWLGNCFGFRADQAYQYQNSAPQAGADGAVLGPYQGGYGYGYGYGPCWAR